MTVPTVKLEGKRFVILEETEYRRLRGLAAGDGPKLPPKDAAGNYPAKEALAVSIARNFLKRRKALGLTQETLAQLAGVRLETVHRLETGKHAPSVKTVDKIDRALARAESKHAS
jgi:DNA-binding XRE family transcriptional regulator